MLKKISTCIQCMLILSPLRACQIQIRTLFMILASSHYPQDTSSLPTLTPSGT